MLNVVHTKVAASGTVSVSLDSVRSLKRADLLEHIRTSDCKMTGYEYRQVPGANVAVLLAPQEKPWTYDTHTFTQLI